MKKKPKLVIGGYTVFERKQAGEVMIVVGHHPTPPAPYATWKAYDFTNFTSFNCGNYFQTKQAAIMESKDENLPVGTRMTLSEAETRIGDLNQRYWDSDEPERPVRVAIDYMLDGEVDRYWLPLRTGPGCVSCCMSSLAPSSMTTWRSWRAGY